MFFLASELGMPIKELTSKLNQFVQKENKTLIKPYDDIDIISGQGTIGKEIAEQLLLEEVQTLIVEIDESRKNTAEEKGMKALLADATLDETLILAGIKECRSLVVTLPTDASNLYVVLSARGLNSNCRLIARAESEEAENTKY